MKEDGGEEVEEGGEGGGEGGGERGRVAEVTKDPKVATLQHYFVGAETEKSQVTPAQKSQVTPDRSHKRPLYRLRTLRFASLLSWPGLISDLLPTCRGRRAQVGAELLQGLHRPALPSWRSCGTWGGGSPVHCQGETSKS